MRGLELLRSFLIPSSGSYVDATPMEVLRAAA
jgi:hypothetical protein